MVVDKADYLDKMDYLLNDTRKFEKINLKNDGILFIFIYFIFNLFIVDKFYLD